MLATVGNLGYIGDVQINGRARPAIGNDLYGSFGRDFATADGRRVMIIALTPRQWRALGQATGLTERLAMIGTMMEVDLDTEAGRYEARDMIAALLGRWCAGRSLDEIRQAFAGTGVLWGQFQDFLQLVQDDPRCSAANPLFAEVEQPGIGPYLMPGLPLDFAAAPRLPPCPAPVLGEHTDLVLAEVLGLSRGRDRPTAQSPDSRRPGRSLASASALGATIFAVVLPQLLQQLAHAARCAQFPGDVGRQPADRPGRRASRPRYRAAVRAWPRRRRERSPRPDALRDAVLWPRAAPPLALTARD